MAFRRSAESTAANRSWKRFAEAKRDVFHALGVSGTVVENRLAFEYLLMHGVPPDDQGQFRVDRLDTRQRAALVSLIRDYFDAGFPNPGLGFLTLEEREALDARSAVTR